MDFFQIFKLFCVFQGKFHFFSYNFDFLNEIPLFLVNENDIFIKFIMISYRESKKIGKFSKKFIKFSIFFQIFT